MTASDSFSVIVAAACPPKVAGPPMATALLLEYLSQARIRCELVDITRPFHLGIRLLSYGRRVLQVLDLPRQVFVAAWRLRGARPIFYLQLGQSLPSMLRDIPMLSVARLCGMPVVLHVHGESFRPALDGAPAWIQRRMRRELGLASRIVVLSPVLAAPFDDLVDAEKLEVIANGVDAELERQAGALADREQGTDGGLRVLYLSNLMTAKGYQDVMEAARLSAQRGLPHRFVLAGSRTETTDIDVQEFVELHSLDNLRWVGPVGGQAKLDLLADSDVFVLPSQFEGQPISLLEAMHFGLPLITTPVGGIVDLVRDGDEGILVSPGDAPAIVAAIERLAADTELRARIGKHNRAAAQASYSRKTHGEAMLRLFRSVSAS